jgi:hypothetical protein
MLSFLCSCYIICWYVSSTFYVTQVASAAGGQHIGVHVLAHALCYGIANCIWEVFIKKKPVDASAFAFPLAAVYHTCGTAAALYGIWFMGGVTTQMIKLLEPVIVLVFMQLLKRAKAELTHRQYLGSCLVIVTVLFRLFMDPSFQFDYFLFALLISIWYPLRNTVWTKDLRLSSSFTSVVLSIGIYACAAAYFGTLGSVDLSVIVPAILFGVYQLSSLLVLDAVEPQMHSTLNVGKRCFVMFGVYFMSEVIDIPKLLVYVVSLAGAALLSFQVSNRKAYFVTAVGLVILACVTVHQSDSYSTTPLVVESETNLVHSAAEAWNDLGRNADVVIFEKYVDPQVDDLANFTLYDASWKYHNGNVGNMVWRYAASTAMIDHEHGCNNFKPFKRYEDPFFDGPPDLLVIPVANIFGDANKNLSPRFLNILTNITRKSKKVMMLGAGSQVNYFGHDRHDIDSPITVPHHTERMKLYSLSEAAQDLLSALVEKSELIGSRGTVTSSIFRQYSVSPKIMSMGCPSLFLYQGNNLGEVMQLNRDKMLTTNDKKSLKFILTLPVVYGKKLLQVFHKITLDHPESIVVLQEPRDLRLLEIAAKAGMNFPRQKWFYTYDSWHKFVCDFDGGVGSRIHGSMMMVACGKPTFIITPDLRVEELAAAMKIPFRSIIDKALTANLSAVDMFALPAPSATEFDNNRQQKAKQYLQAFHKEGVVGSKNMYLIAGEKSPRSCLDSSM